MANYNSRQAAGAAGDLQRLVHEQTVEKQSPWQNLSTAREQL
jgi:hypothetical protein